MVALQRLYAVFLPPHLRLSQETREKRRKIKNRPAIYTGYSRTTVYRRGLSREKAAQGCGKLENFGFIQRKVGQSNDPQSEVSYRHRRDHATPHRLRKVQWKSLTAMGRRKHHLLLRSRHNQIQWKSLTAMRSHRHHPSSKSKQP